MTRGHGPGVFGFQMEQEMPASVVSSPLAGFGSSICLAFFVSGSAGSGSSLEGTGGFLAVGGAAAGFVPGFEAGGFCALVCEWATNGSVQARQESMAGAIIKGYLLISLIPIAELSRSAGSKEWVQAACTAAAAPGGTSISV